MAASKNRFQFLKAQLQKQLIYNSFIIEDKEILENGHSQINYVCSWHIKLHKNVISGSQGKNGKKK